MKEIIDSSIYENTSLSEDIDFLCSTKKEITDKKLINLIIKYFFVYKENNEINNKIPLDHINYLFDFANNYFDYSRKYPYGEDLLSGKFSFFNDYDYRGNDFEAQLFVYFQKHGYALSMLGDVSSTIVIFKDIIGRVIKKEKFNGNYVGLDLGTGSGILLLAQYIQAIRNKFNNIENKGFDISSSVNSTKTLIEKLGIGEIIHGDTTKKETYNKINGDYITHISNETIPMPGVSMGTLSDPFIENNFALFSGLEGKIIESTNFFPSDIKMPLILGNYFNEEIIGNKNNKFQTKFIKKISDKIRKGDFDIEDDWSLLKHIFSEEIKINGTYIKLENIGKELINSGIVKELPNWRYRWRKI